MNPMQTTSAFEALEEQFLRVAERDARRPSRRRRLLLALAVTGVIAPGAFAVAQAIDPDPSPEVVPGVDVPAEPTAPVPPPTAEGESTNVLGEGPLPPQLVERCREDSNAESSCDLVLAIEAGKIAPGTYTDQELRQALIDAGYDGDF